MGHTDAAATLHNFLAAAPPDGIRIGQPVGGGALILFPVFHEGPSKRYLLYTDAAARGLVRVTELNDHGSVGTLLASNDATIPVLFLEGEMLVGMKQNRTLTASVLVPAGVTLPISVACVERGRWRNAAGPVKGDDYLLSPRVRAVKNASVQQSLRTRGAHVADQRAVWEGVDEALAAHAAPSDSSAYAAIHNKRGRELDEILANLRPLAGQAGVIALVDGAPRFGDIFDRPSSLRRVWPRLVGSYAADALVTDGAGVLVPLTSDDVAAWLQRLREAETTVHPGVGLGSTVAVSASDRGLSALVVDSVVAHLSVFAR